MKELFDKSVAWIKSNIWLSIAIGLVVILLFFGKTVKRLFVSPKRRRRSGTKSGKPLPRSVGTRRRVKRAYTKSGKAKKPWQIKGSEAARRHMRKIRSMR